MEQVKLALKIQQGDKVKRLLEKEYASLAELKDIIQGSFKNLRPSSYVLKYKDSEDDWLYIFDDSDLQALKEFSREKSGKPIKLVIETEEELAQSTVEPKRFNQSQVKDSCVAEVEAYLKSQEPQDNKVEEEKEEVSKPEETEMEVEVIEFDNKGTEHKESEELVHQLRESFENTNIQETQPESFQEEMSIEPVVVEESAKEEVKAEIPVEEPKDVEIEEENIDTSPQQQEQQELKDFNIFELLTNVQNALNKNQNEFKPKDVFQAVKESVKGTKAEKNIEKAKRQCKKGKGFFFKKLIKGFLSGGACQEQNSQKPNVVHHGITCDGCSVSPVVGVRYKCSECPDYDLCQDCEAKDVHNHHVFLKLKYPMGVDIIYSHRTDDNGAAQTPAPPAPPHHPPHHPPHPHEGWGHHPWGPPMRGPWGHGHGHGHGPRGPRGPRGGRRCHRNWENNPLMQLAQQFLGGFNSNDSEGSSSPSRRERPQGGWALKRPVITQKPSGPLVGTQGGMQIVETTIQNQSPFPYRLKNVKLLEADEGITFQEIETDLVLNKDESQDFCLAVQLPQKPGTYKARFGFFNGKGLNHGEKLEAVFEVLPETSE
jgi:hypothetical protein